MKKNKHDFRNCSDFIKRNYLTDTETSLEKDFVLFLTDLKNRTKKMFLLAVFAIKKKIYILPLFISSVSTMSYFITL